ncbi:MAG: histidine kinase [Bacteroidota bacterium]
MISSLGEDAPSLGECAIGPLWGKKYQKKVSYLYGRMQLMKYILYLLVLFVACPLYGQKEKDKMSSKYKRYRGPTLLEQAEALQEKSPKEAIQILQRAVLEATKKGDFQSESEAYVLLGNIYENIDQKELAVQRYEQALAALGKSKRRLPNAEIHQRIGQLSVELGDDKKAETNFRMCINTSRKEELKLKCEEGLIDVQLLRGDGFSTVKMLDSITSNYAMDSLSFARIEARRSQGYVQQNDYSNASQSFYNSLEALPTNIKLDREDMVPIEMAQQKLLDFEAASNTGKIQLQGRLQQIINQQDENDNFIKNNSIIASLYEEDDNLAEAKKFIDLSKEIISEKTDAAVAADVYKKSAELNQRNGNLSAALDDFDKYIAAKEKAIQNLENDLRQQVEIVKGQKELDEQKQIYNLQEKERELFQSQLTTQKIIIGFLSLLLVASLVYFYFLFKNVKAKRKANQMLLLKSLRTQMNPHFIFNALNSVNNFIAKNDEKSANKFLSEFSRLMRKVLDYSQKDFIAFEEEMELNELYLKLEHFRFRDKFDYTFKNNAKKYGYDLDIPPMLIQPFIENAVWHGLRYKEENGHLSVKVEEKEDGIIVEIKDDGIGRKKSKALKTKNQKKIKSTGLENVSRRIALINEIYDKNYEINVSDVNENKEDTGTLVQIRIPVNRG